MTTEQSSHILLKDIEGPYQDQHNQTLYLRDISLEITAGEVVAFLGRSDSGKQALLKCIGLIERPSSGIVSIDNKNLTVLANSEIYAQRQRFGFVSSEIVLLQSKTIAENIGLVLQILDIDTSTIRHRVNDLAKSLDISECLHLFPEELSSIQLYLVEIAKALINNPKILLIDDIFNSLDLKASNKLQETITKLNKALNLTTIISTNDAAVIKNICEKIYIFDRGEIVETTTAYDLFTHPKSIVAKDYLKICTKHEIPSTFRRNLTSQYTEDKYALVRMNFDTKTSTDGLLSNALQSNELRMNIVQAYQEKIQDEIVNVMLLEVHGRKSAIDAALEYLDHNKLYSEVIGYVPSID